MTDKKPPTARAKKLARKLRVQADLLERYARRPPKGLSKTKRGTGSDENLQAHND